LKKGFENKHPDKINRVKYGYIDVLSQNLGFVEYHLTEDDIVMFDEWCDKIDSTEIFMPKRGLIPYCKKCPFNDPCSKWKKEK
jgi:CRISPR/Cas system-associated exonuclease Cas4 (RecB family)